VGLTLLLAGIAIAKSLASIRLLWLSEAPQVLTCTGLHLQSAGPQGRLAPQLARHHARLCVKTAAASRRPSLLSACSKAERAKEIARNKKERQLQRAALKQR